MSSPPSEASLLWDYYPVFRRDEEFALLHPVHMNVLYLDQEEYDSLLQNKPTPELHALLQKALFVRRNFSGSYADDILSHISERRLSSYPERISGVRVVLTDACNMKCTYCFVETNVGRIKFSQKDLVSSLRQLLSVNRNQQRFRIQWFGGEPLLKFDLIKAADFSLAVMQNEFGIRELHRSIVTNGLVLRDEQIAHFKSLNYHVGVSYDGDIPTGEHRVSLSGRNVTTKIKSNIKRLVDTDGIYVGVNVTPTRESIRHLIETVNECITEFGIKFIYVNTPITRKGRWDCPGRELADELYRARQFALSKGAMVFSALDRVFQALDTRSARVLDHIQGDGGMNAALLPDGNVSLCDVNWEDVSLIVPLNELVEQGPEKLAGSRKRLFPASDCKSCIAAGVCGGPPRSEYYDGKPQQLDLEYCAFLKRSLELAVWDDTGLQ